MKREDLVRMVWAVTVRSKGKSLPGMIDRAITIGRALSSLDERYCERDLTPREASRRRNLVAEAERLAESLGAKAYHQADPRGAALYLVWPEDMSPGGDIREHYTNGVAIY